MFKKFRPRFQWKFLERRWKNSPQRLKVSRVWISPNHSAASHACCAIKRFLSMKQQSSKYFQFSTCGSLKCSQTSRLSVSTEIYVQIADSRLWGSFHRHSLAEKIHLKFRTWIVDNRTCRMKKLFVLVSLFVFGSCGENSVSINVKNVANTISDRFISYEVKFSDLMNQFVEQKKSFENLGLILPSYLKLEGLAAYLRDENRKYDEKNVAAVFERLR